MLIDLPYEPGAFGYMRYDPTRLQPTGVVVSVITHHHRDHFDPALFLPRTPWLQCSLREAGRAASWERAVLYHRRPDGSDPVCGPAEALGQGANFVVSAVR